MRFRAWAAVLLPAILTAADNWVAMGENATIAKSGNTVILDYKVSPGKAAMAVLPVGEGSLAGLSHIQFRARTDVSTMLGVLLSETKPGGGDYTAVFWSPKDQWQQIDLTPADFSLNDGAKDPKDADGRLDLEQVQAVGIVDAGQLFNQPRGNGKLPFAVAGLSGEHKLSVEDLRFVTEGKAQPGKGVIVDDFGRGFLRWFKLGDGELSLNSGTNPLKKAALEFHYRQEAAQFTILLHPLGQTDLRGATELSFDISSTHDAHFILALEMQKIEGRPGARYNHDFLVGAGQVGHMQIPLSEFTLAEDSPPDPVGHLDPGKVRSLGLVDLSGILEGGKEKNTLWLADLRTQ
jgi:hypothetical protein